MADDHYCIPPLDRVDLDEILQLIEWKKYFVLHGPRQTGKTSMLLALAELLNADGKYRCLYINVEPAKAARGDVGAAMTTVLDELSKCATETFGDESVHALRDAVLKHQAPGRALNLLLRRWVASSPKPLVLLVDEIDAMIGDSLISVLRQLRAGYDLRPQRFPQTVILCGVRDVCDYRDYATAGSGFNIKAKSIRLGNFSETEMRALLAQHTADTGQPFEARAVERIWKLTLGQPWVVNALAQQVCFKERSGRDRSRAIGETAIDNAKETLILKRATHLDQLAAKLAEDRVRRVIEPILAGGKPQHSRADRVYARDLGLIAPKGPARIANPIYSEVLSRGLTEDLQDVADQDVTPIPDSAGNLRNTRVLEGFQ